MKIFENIIDRETQILQKGPMTVEMEGSTCDVTKSK